MKRFSVHDSNGEQIGWVLTADFQRWFKQPLDAHQDCNVMGEEFGSRKDATEALFAEVKGE